MWIFNRSYTKRTMGRVILAWLRDEAYGTLIYEFVTREKRDVLFNVSKYIHFSWFNQITSKYIPLKLRILSYADVFVQLSNPPFASSK